MKATASEINAKIRLATYDHAQREAVIRVFNKEMADCPYAAVLTEELLDRNVHKSYFDPEGLVVGYRGNDPVGWVHSTFARPKEGQIRLDYSIGNIRMLVYPPEDPEMGRALIEQAMDYLKKSGALEIQGWSSFSGYPFDKGLYMGTEPVLSANLPHVAVRFVQAGFKLVQESIFMSRSLEALPPFVQAKPEISFVQEPLRLEDRWEIDSWSGLEPMCIYAVRDGKRLGRLVWAMLPELSVKRRGTAALHTYYSAGFAEKELLLGYFYK